MTGTLHVLVLDDSEDDAELTIAALRRAGHRVEFERIESAVAMRRALAERTWDLIACDWAMPEFSAPEALELYKTTGLDIPFIIVSGMVGEERAVDLMRAGAHDYVLKDRLTRLAPAVERELRDAEGRAQQRCAEAVLATARSKAEASLRVSEDRFRSLWESGIILITISDLHGNIVDVNEGFTRAVGYSRDELLSGQVRWSDLTPSKWTEADRIALAQLAKAGAASPWEKELIAKDGSRVPILAGAVMLEASEGITIAIDLTDRKRVDRALYERMKAAALTADIGIAMTCQSTLPVMLQASADAIVRHLDAAFARIWTLDPATRELELQASAGLHAQPAGGATRMRVGDLEIGKSYPLVVGGELVGVIEMFSREQPMPDAVVEGLRAVADGIAVGIRRNRAESAKEALEAQLRQAQKLEAIGSLAGGVAHDFNNILSVILTYSEFMREDLEPGHPMLDSVGEIHDAATRAAGLTRQLLAFSRQQVLKPRVLNLNQVVGDLTSMLRRLLTEDIELVITGDPTIGNISADPGQIEQVLMNLVVNARDAIRGPGTVTVTTASVELDATFVADHFGLAPGRHTRLCVTDTGDGMTAATRARIFEPFFTTKATGKGTGLGLSTVFGIVQQSGGAIFVDSELGRGTRFEVYLPVSTAVVLAEGSGLTQIHGGSETILLCEDEVPVRVVTREILSRHGYHVIEARNGGEAILLCEQHPSIDLLVTDVVMPMMSGRQLAERLRSLRPQLKVLYMSGYTDDAIVRHGILTDELAFLQKPITPDDLSRKVREVLDSARPG